MNTTSHGTFHDHEPSTALLRATPDVFLDSESERISLLLGLDMVGVMSSDLRARLLGLGFGLKNEIHVTALDIKAGSRSMEVLTTLSPEAHAEVLRVINQASNRDWKVSLGDTYYLLEKQYDDEAAPRKSIIQTVRCPAVKDFYRELNANMPHGHEFEVPFLHVTLATQGSPRGIGLTSASQLQEFGVEITLS